MIAPAISNERGEEERRQKKKNEKTHSSFECVNDGWMGGAIIRQDKQE